MTIQTQMMSQTKSTLIYVGDPLCSWCYGIAPELATTIDELPEELSFKIIMGGLRPYNTQTMTELGDFLKEHWEHVKERSGQPFNYGILKDSSFVYDTEPPSRAILVVRKLKPAAEFKFFKAVQKAFYLDNKNTNDVESYLALAKDFDIDPDLFKTTFESQEMKDAMRAEFQLANDLGVRSFPTMVLMKEDKGETTYHLIASGYDTSKNIMKRVKQELDTIEK